jgi:hypothetical protein
MEDSELKYNQIEKLFLTRLSLLATGMASVILQFYLSFFRKGDLVHAVCQITNIKLHALQDMRRPFFVVFKAKV